MPLVACQIQLVTVMVYATNVRTVFNCQAWPSASHCVIGESGKQLLAHGKVL